MNQFPQSRLRPIGYDSFRLISVSAIVVLFLTISPPSTSQNFSDVESKSYYVSAGSGANGDGSPSRPFRSLVEAEAISVAGDTIYLVSGNGIGELNGGIALKSGQKLLGIDSSGNLAEAEDDRVKLTNTSSVLDGVMVQLADHNEVAGIHFMDMSNYAISALGTNYSGTYIHHTTFTGNATEHIEDERGLVYSISLDATEGNIDNVIIENSGFYNGDDLGAIRVFHSGNSQGNYRFQGNDFSDLGGRAYFVRTQNTSRVETIILDSNADNIGLGDRNSDSIIPYLMGQSEQIMVIRNYHFQNTKQVGNQSNTGIEAYMFGEPRPDKANWCTNCKLTLKILDSVIENSVTDPIQFSNSGRNSELTYEIRNSRIVGGNPRQGGGAISLNLQGVPGSGGSTTLLVEYSDIVGSTGYGFVMNNRGGDDGHAATIDFGGGALGSLGNNRFIDNKRGEMRVPQYRVTARNNWWGGGKPNIYNSEDEVWEGSKVEIEPVLDVDPRQK